MAQLNINQTPEFEEDLLRLMKVRKISTKSEAVRVAVKESLDRALREAPPVNYRDWLNLGCGEGENLKPRFGAHDELWS